jgi:hypothetical protein
MYRIYGIHWFWRQTRRCGWGEVSFVAAEDITGFYDDIPFESSHTKFIARKTFTL